MTEIVSKCTTWNSARYNCEYNYDLAINLLLEELDELSDASSVVDMLDAIGDITFVAIGVMWKLGIPVEVIKSYFPQELREANSKEMFNHCCYILNDYADHAYRADMPDMEMRMPGLSLAVYATFLTALNALRGLGMQDSFFDIVDAICDSNNTKEVKGKTDAAIKANVVKGAGYVPPTARLAQIEFLYNVKQAGAKS